jgi:hypothetical protein
LVNNDNFIELKTKKTQKGVREKLFIYIFNKSSKRDKRDEMRSPSQTKKDLMSNVVRQFIEGLGTKMKAKLAKKCFILFFWAKHDSYDYYLKNGLIQNRLFQKRFLVKSHFL